MTRFLKKQERYWIKTPVGASISALSDEEIRNLHAIREEWIRLTYFGGDDCDNLKIMEGIAWLYSTRGKKQPIVAILDSPFACLNEVNSIRKSSSLKYAQWLRLHAQSSMYSIWPTIENELETSLHEAVSGTTSRHSIEMQHILNQCAKQSMSATLKALAKKLVDDIRRESAMNLIVSEENLLLLHEKMIRYSYLQNSEQVKSDSFDCLVEFLQSGVFFSIYSYEHAFISRRPVETKFNEHMALHCDGGPAIKWRDGSELFYLNGVRVPKGIAMIPTDRLDPELVLSEWNAEVRREIIRKIGMNRVMSEFKGRVIDAWNGYELIKLNIPKMKTIPVYLKMTNPSTGFIHFEGVPPEIAKCRDALSWRVGGVQWTPEQLT